MFSRRAVHRPGRICRPNRRPAPACGLLKLLFEGDEIDGPGSEASWCNPAIDLAVALEEKIVLLQGDCRWLNSLVSSSTAPRTERSASMLGGRVFSRVASPGIDGYSKTSCTAGGGGGGDSPGATAPPRGMDGCERGASYSASAGCSPGYARSLRGAVDRDGVLADRLDRLLEEDLPLVHFDLWGASFSAMSMLCRTEEVPPSPALRLSSGQPGDLPGNDLGVSFPSCRAWRADCCSILMFLRCPPVAATASLAWGSDSCAVARGDLDQFTVFPSFSTSCFKMTCIIPLP